MVERSVSVTVISRDLADQGQTRGMTRRADHHPPGNVLMHPQYFLLEL